jgi:oligoendopeptidase F
LNPTEQYTWDLSHLYPSTEEWEKDRHEIEALLKQIVAKKGTITTSARNLLETLTLMDQLGIKLERAASYAKMKFDADMSNAAAKKNYEKLDILYTKISSALAFYEPELLQMQPETFHQYIEELPELETYRFMFEKLFQMKAHILTPAEEEILSQMGALGGTFEKIYDDLTVNDLKYPEIEDDTGQKITANEAHYRKALNSRDRAFRARFFQALLNTYGSSINSITSIIYGNIRYHAFLAKTRKYASSREMALQQNHIPIHVYDSLIETVRSNVHQLQRYLDLRKRKLGYPDLHFYDLFVPFTKNVDKTYSFEEARETVLAALSILGEEYTKVLKQAFTERWIDVYPKKGKVSGAYANGVYGVHPYSLLNFTGTLDDLFTMAHELGHVMHSYYSNLHQPYVNADYVIFTAEVASTVNEYFLYRYLLNRATDPEERNYLLSMHLDSIRSTLYRQAFFADFEMQMHQLVAEETPLTPELLCQKYHGLYEYYHGPDFTIDRELTYEWARIPHFYRPFYVYQYATGISAAICLAQQIEQQKEGALEAYLHFLTTGGSDYPINLLKKAGVDMTSSGPVLAAIDDFASCLDLLETT